MITGTTTTSMMAVALKRISRSADATGPSGSSTPDPRHASTREAAPSAAKVCDREKRTQQLVMARDIAALGSEGCCILGNLLSFERMGRLYQTIVRRYPAYPRCRLICSRPSEHSLCARV